MISSSVLSANTESPIENESEYKRKTVLWCDNSSTVAVSANLILHSKFNHVELDLFFVREKVAMGKVIVGYVLAQDQVVDVLTKPLLARCFNMFKTRLKVVSKTEWLQRMALRVRSMHIVPQICGFIMKFAEAINSEALVMVGTEMEKLWSMLTADSARLVPRMWICPDDDKESGHCSGEEYDVSGIGEFWIECPKCQFEVKLMKLTMRDEI
ncbi:putative N-acetyl-gamma-glutamyl-phosphate reductase, chloroplastic [Gossypium australe]|uniref:Putative N-acetyl-gamma-glutamyl-phosphate reductase, chloroplastic n=1 Tax=Gossypium australe TaxID=47621 RepID=A0A5B6VWP9_9ROSI|nr:putative N-acetyl-gamma-glutamyl-phosphate reductase, chloroplastic [Gossypium australe]